MFCSNYSEFFFPFQGAQYAEKTLKHLLRWMISMDSSCTSKALII